MAQAATRPATRPAEDAMKVFLSHSTRDKAFVEKLAAALIGAGFTPWLCEVDIEKNENFVAKIEEGLKQCDVALVVWSPDAAKSDWTKEEWTAVLARQVSEQRVRLGIVLLRDHPLPELLRTKNYIDARSNEHDGLRDTIAWLKRRETAQRLSGLKAPIYLPDYRPQDFVGRAAYLDLLRNTLTAEPTVFLLYGEPGSGKSTLALQFAWEAQKDFDAVIFHTCGQRPLDAITAELVERLPIDVKTRPPDKQRKEAIKWLKARQSLLVLDDVWSPEVRQLEPGPACSVLYTSRLQSLPGLAAKLSSKVEKFTEPECDDLFHATLDPLFGAEEVTRHRDALLGFAAQVDMLPIAVAVGASLLREKAAIAPRQRGEEAPARGAYRWRQGCARLVPQGHRVAARSRAEAAGRLCRLRAGRLLATARSADCGTQRKTTPRMPPLVDASSLLRVLDREP